MHLGSVVICVTSDPKLKRVIRRTLNAVRQEVFFVPGVADLQGLNELQPNLVIADLAGEALSALRRNLADLGWDAPVLAMGNWSAQEEALNLLDLCDCRNLIARTDSVDEAELLVTSLKMIGGDIFGVEKYLAWGAQVREMTVSSYDDKRQAIETVAGFAREVGCRRSLIQRVEIVADELLMNALYDAPASLSGRRSEYVERAVPGGGPVSERAVGLRVACDGRFFALSVRDHFGTLERRAIVEHLSRAISLAGAPLTHTDQGAGLGLYFILNSVSRFVANIQPGVATEVICLFDLRIRRAQTPSVAQSFNIFTTAPQEAVTTGPPP